MFKKLNISTQKNNNITSLTLLKTKALKAAFKVETLLVQKFINKNDVKPTSSQPKKIKKTFPAETKIIILITNKFK